MEDQVDLQHGHPLDMMSGPPPTGGGPPIPPGGILMGVAIPMGGPWQPPPPPPNMPSSNGGGNTTATGSNGGGMGSAHPGIPGVELTDADILISSGLEHSRTREANLEYQRLLLANCVLFCSLPSHFQSVHAQHLYHFLTHVRGRRFLQCIAPNVYVPFLNGPFQIAQEITGDACKTAFVSRNPQWMLDGLRSFTTTPDPAAEASWAHRVNPRGNEWELVSLEQVKDILKDEGPVHLIILPPGIEIKPVVDLDSSPPPPAKEEHEEDEDHQQQTQQQAQSPTPPQVDNSTGIEDESHLKKEDPNGEVHAGAVEGASNDEQVQPQPHHDTDDKVLSGLAEHEQENIIEVAAQAAAEAVQQHSGVVDTEHHHHHHQSEEELIPPPASIHGLDDSPSVQQSKRAKHDHLEEEQPF